MCALLLVAALVAAVQGFVAPAPAQTTRTRVRLRAAFKQNDVKKLLASKRNAIDALGKAAPETSELTRLRFALAFPSARGTDVASARAALREAVAWRAGPGKAITDAAKEAVAAATAGGGWDNEPVRAAAPHAAAINEFITPKNILTLSTDDGDLVYVIRASLIDDRKLMRRVSVAQLTDFFLYVKEVHSLIVDGRAARTGRLAGVIFANDISGISAIPDAKFSQALTESSNQYEKLYPTLAGPTMILNLPFLIQGFVGLIKPLFPPSVQDRLVFESAPYLAGLDELTPLTAGEPAKAAFLAEVKRKLPQ